MKTEQEIADELARREIRIATGSSEVNRPLCVDEKYVDEGWIAALRWVLNKKKQKKRLR